VYTGPPSRDNHAAKPPKKPAAAASAAYPSCHPPGVHAVEGVLAAPISQPTEHPRRCCQLPQAQRSIADEAMPIPWAKQTFTAAEACGHARCAASERSQPVVLTHGAPLRNKPHVALKGVDLLILSHGRLAWLAAAATADAIATQSRVRGPCTRTTRARRPGCSPRKVLACGPTQAASRCAEPERGPLVRLEQGLSADSRGSSRASMHPARPRLGYCVWLGGGVRTPARVRLERDGPGSSPGPARPGGAGRARAAEGRTQAD
jgi:hypothetical protein